MASNELPGALRASGDAGRVTMRPSSGSVCRFGRPQASVQAVSRGRRVTFGRELSAYR